MEMAITIASKGNAVDFGDIKNGVYGACRISNHEEESMLEGHTGPWWKAEWINYLTMSSDGNATEFGDLTVIKI